MRNIKTEFALWTLALIGALALTPASHAASYRVHQDGFTGGGEVSLSFEGIDLDQDGLLSTWVEGEVSQAQLTFTGSTELPDYASGPIGRHELNMSIKLGEVTSADDVLESIYFSDFSNADAPPGKSLKGYFGGNTDGGSQGIIAVLWGSENSVLTGPVSLSLITVSQVPEPGTGSLLAMGLGLGTLVVYGRRQHS